jgi:hypothetical protein
MANGNGGNKGGDKGKTHDNPFSSPKEIIDLNAPATFSDDTYKSVIDPQEYNQYMGEGVQYLPDMERFKTRQQGWVTQLGNFAAQSLAEIVGGTVSGLGSIYEAGQYALSKEARKEADFNNWAIQFGEDVMAWSKDEFPIRRLNPNKAFDLGDSGWWFENAVSLSSTLSLLAPSMIATKGLGWIGKVMKVTDKLGDTTKFWTKSLATAGIMRNAENFRESLAVTNEIREEAMDTFGQMSTEEFQSYLKDNPELTEEFMSYKGPKTVENFADFLGARSGWMSYKINSMNFAFDLLQTTLIFKGLGKNTRTGFLGKKKVATAQSGLTTSKVASKLRAERAKGAFGVFAGAASEGIEEIVNFIGGEEGRYFGKTTLSPDEKSDFEFRLDNYLNDPHAWNAGLWGMVGGLAFDRIGSALNKKSRDQIVAGKMAEIENRKQSVIKFEDDLKKLKERYDKGEITDRDYSVEKNNITRSLSYNLGINAAANGNVDLLLDHLESEDFMSTLEESGVDPTLAEDFKEQFVGDVLKAERAYKSAHDRIFKKKYDENLKARVVALDTQLNLAVQDQQKELIDIEDDINRMLEEEGETYSNPSVYKSVNEREAVKQTIRGIKQAILSGNLAPDYVSVLSDKLTELEKSLDDLNNSLTDENTDSVPINEDLVERLSEKYVREAQLGRTQKAKADINKKEFMDTQQKNLEKMREEAADEDFQNWQKDVKDKKYSSATLALMIDKETDTKKSRFLKKEYQIAKNKEKLIGKTREFEEEQKQQNAQPEDIQETTQQEEADQAQEPETEEALDVDPETELVQAIGATRATNFINEVQYTIDASPNDKIKQINLTDLLETVEELKGRDSAEAKYLRSKIPSSSTGKEETKTVENETQKTEVEASNRQTERLTEEAEETTTEIERDSEGDDGQSLMPKIDEDTVNDTSFKEVSTAPKDKTKPTPEPKSASKEALDEFKDAFKSLSDEIRKSTNAGVPLTPEVINAGLKLLKAGAKLGFATVKDIARFAKNKLSGFDDTMLSALKGAYAFAETTGTLPEGLRAGEDVKSIKFEELDTDVNTLDGFDEKVIKDGSANFIPSPFNFDLVETEDGFESLNAETDQRIKEIINLKEGDKIQIKVDSTNELNKDNPDEYAIGIYSNGLLIGHLYTIPTIERALENATSDQFKLVLMQNLKATKALRSKIKPGQTYQSTITNKSPGTKIQREWRPVNEVLQGPKRLMFRDPSKGEQDSQRLISYKDDKVFNKINNDPYYNKDLIYDKGAFYVLVQGLNDNSGFDTEEDLQNKIPLRVRVSTLQRKDANKLYGIIVKVVELMNSGDIDFANNAALNQYRDQIAEITAFNKFNQRADGSVPSPYFKIHKNYLEFTYEGGDKMIRLYYNPKSNPVAEVWDITEPRPEYSNWAKFRESIKNTGEKYQFIGKEALGARDFLIDALMTKQYNIQLAKLESGEITEEEIFESGKLITDTGVLYDSKGNPLTNFVSRLQGRKTSNLVISVDQNIKDEVVEDPEEVKSPRPNKPKKPKVYQSPVEKQIFANQKLISKGEEFYIYDDGTGKPREFRRVSSVIGNTFTGDSSAFENARIAGTNLDELIRRFFEGEDLQYADFKDQMSEDVFTAVVVDLNKIGDQIQKRGQRFLTNNIIVFDIDAGIAGEIDILAVNKDGTFSIYDIKSSKSSIQDAKYSKRSYTGNGITRTKKEQHEAQQSMYKAMFEKQYDTEIKEIAILPFLIGYDSDGFILSARKKKGVLLNYNQDVVDIYLKPEEVKKIEKGRAIEESGKSEDELTLEEKLVLRAKKRKDMRDKEGLDTEDYDAYTMAKSKDRKVPYELPTAEERIANWERMFGKNVPYDPNVDQIIYKGESVYGLFSEAVAQTVKGAPIGAEFHEGFHVVMHLYYNEDQRNELYSQAKKKLGQQLSDREVEERMAEEFRLYATTRKTGLGKYIQEFFDKLLSFVENILGDPRRSLYRDIYKGKFNYQPPARHVEYAKKIGMTMAYDLEAEFGKQNLDSYVNFLSGRINQWLGKNRTTTLRQRAEDPEKNVYKKMKGLLLNRAEERDRWAERALAEGNAQAAAMYMQASEEIDRILENFGDDNVGIWSLVVKNVKQQLDFDIAGANSINELEESAIMSKMWDDTLAYRRSSKESFDTELKRIISGTRLMDGFEIDVESGDISYQFEFDNVAMLPQFVNFDKFYPTLVNNMVNAGNEQEMMDRLYELGKVHASYLLLWERVSKDPITKAAWLSNFNKSFIKQEHIRLNPNNKGGFSVVKERSNKEYKLADKFLREINILIEKDKTTPVFTKEKSDRANALAYTIETQLKELNFGEEVFNNFEKLVKEIGLEISAEFFEKLIKDQIVNNGQPLAFAREVLSMINFVKDDLFRKVEKGTDEIVFNSKGRLNELAGYLSYYLLDSESSFYSTKGNLVYSISESNALTNFFDKFERLKNKRNVNKEDAQDVIVNLVKDLLRDPSLEFSNWLYKNGKANSMLKVERGQKSVDAITFQDINMEFINNFQAYRDDHIKRVDTGRGSEFSDLSDKDWEMESILHFLTGKRYTANYSIPIIPDSGNIWFIEAPKYSIYEGGKSVIDKSFNVATGSNIFKRVLNTVWQEVARMDQAFHLLFEFKDGQLVEKELTDEVKYALKNNYHYKGTKPDGSPMLLKDGKPTGRVFQFFNTNFTDKNGNERSLNNIESLKINGYLNKNLITKVDRIAIINHVREFLKNEIENDYRNLREQYSTLRNSKNNKDSAIVGEFTNFRDFVASYTINNYLFNVEFYSILGGVPAEYKNSRDQFKRTKQVISPKRPGSLVHRGETYKAIAVKDVIGEAFYYETIVKDVAKKLVESGRFESTNYDVEILRSKNVENMNDLERELNFLTSGYLNIEKSDAQSIMTLERYKNTLKDYGRWNEFEKLITDIEEGKEINPYQYKRMLEVIKPFYYERVFDPITGRMASRQLKTSTLVMLPQFYKGTAMENVIDWMENNGVEEMYFASSYKVGNGYLAKLYDGEGKIAENLDEILKPETFHNANWGIQLDVPDHIREEKNGDVVKNKLGVQISKLMFNNLSSDPIYDIDGQKYTGEQLFDKFSSLLLANLKDDLNGVLKELGASKVMEGQTVTEYYYENYENIRDLLVREIDKRGGNINVQKSLMLDENGDFVMPLFASMMAKKYESILTSLFTNNITNQKFPGSHLVLATDSLLGTVYETNEIDLIDEYKQKFTDAGGIKLSPPVLDENGNVKEVEVLMPAYSKHFFKDGKQIPINEIPKEVLEQIGYRIPTEAGYSFFTLKVVGFLPVSMGSTAIFPHELVTITGWDFDVDSIYMMQHEFGKDLKLDTEGRAGRNNEMLKIFKSITTNGYHYRERVSPGKFTDPLELKRRQEELSGIKVDTLNVNTKATQNFFRSTSMSGRTLKGISANANAFFSILQKAQAKIKGDIASEAFTARYNLNEVNEEELIQKYGHMNVINWNNVEGAEGSEYENRIDVVHSMLAHNRIDNTNINGENINEHAAQMLAMILDIIKEGIPYNINTETFNPFISMVMSGMTIQYAGMFIYQPVIRRVVDKILDSQGIMNDDNINAINLVSRDYKTKLYKLLVDNGHIDKQDAIKRGMMDKNGVWKKNRSFYLTNSERAQGIEEDNFLNVSNKRGYTQSELESYIAMTNRGKLSAADKAKGYKSFNELTDEDRIVFYENQLNILNKYKEIAKIGREFAALAQASSADKLGAGPSMFVTDNLLQSIKDLQTKENPVIVNDVNESIIGDILNEETGYKPLIHYMKMSNLESLKALSPLFIQRSLGFRYVRDKVAEKLPSKLNESTYDTINKAVYTALLYETEYIQGLQDKRSEILGIDGETELDIGMSIDQFRKLSTANKLYLVQKMQEFDEFHIVSYMLPGLDSFSREAAGFDMIKFNKPKTSDNLDDFLINSFMDMFNSDNEYIRDLAKSLLDYNILVHGMQFGKDSWADLIPIEVLNSDNFLGLGNFLNIAKSVLDAEVMQMDTDFIFQINWSNSDFVPRVRSKYAKDGNGQLVKDENMYGEFLGHVTEDKTFDWNSHNANGILRVPKKKLAKEDYKVQNASYLLLTDNKGDSTLFKRYFTGEYSVDNPFNTKVEKYVYYYPISKLGNNRIRIEFAEESIFEENNVKFSKEYFEDKLESNFAPILKEMNKNDRSNDIIC